jgi:hypothetical protein
MGPPNRGLNILSNQGKRKCCILHFWDSPSLPAWLPDCQEAYRCGTSRHASSAAAGIGPHLEDPILSKQGIFMVVANLSCNNAHERLLKLQKSPDLCLVPVCLKVPPKPSDSTGGLAEPYYYRGRERDAHPDPPWPYPTPPGAYPSPGRCGPST